MKDTTRKTPNTFKRSIEMSLRKVGLEPLIYYYVFLKDRRKHGKADAKYLAQNPTVRLPPPRLRFDVIACGNAEYYVNSGIKMATQIHALTTR